MSLFSRTFGLKRYLAAALTALAGVLAGNPSTILLLPVVAKLAAVLGLTGLVHAGKGGSLLTDNKLLSLGALFPLLIEAADAIPALHPYKELLLIIGSLLGLSIVSTQALPQPAKPKATVKVLGKKK